jgi:hypothetical protein
MEKPIVNEKEQATIVVRSISFPKEPVGKFWGKLWILTASHGFFNLVVTKQRHFAHLHPPIPLHLLHVAPLVGLTMSLQRGVMLP